MGDTFEGCVEVRAPQDLKTRTHDRRAVALPAGKCIIRITQDLAVRCGGEQSCLRPPARNGLSFGIWLFWSYGVVGWKKKRTAQGMRDLEAPCGRGVFDRSCLGTCCNEC